MNTSLVGSEPLPVPALFRLPRYRSQPKMAITIPRTTTARITHSTACMTAPSALRADGVGGVGNRLDDPGGAVGHDLGHGPAHLGGVEAHHGHRVGPHGRGVLHHAVERLAPGVLVELDVRSDLAADQALEGGGDVAAEAPRPDGEAEHLADCLHHPGARDVLGGGD